MTDADTQVMSMRLPKGLYERLRKTAFDTRESMNSIVTRAVERELSVSPETRNDPKENES
jgi:hypothetical protein